MPIELKIVQKFVNDPAKHTVDFLFTDHRGFGLKIADDVVVDEPAFRPGTPVLVQNECLKIDGSEMTMDLVIGIISCRDQKVGQELVHKDLKRFWLVK